MTDNKTNAINTNIIADLDIIQYLPHRPPFLFVDKVLTVMQEQIHAQLIVTRHLSMFEGHFPGNPVFPGVLMIEALAQAGCILMIYNHNSVIQNNTHHNTESITDRGNTYLTKIEQSSFKRLVTPNDILDLKVTIVQQRAIRANTYYVFEGAACVANEIACTTKFSAVFVKA